MSSTSGNYDPQSAVSVTGSVYSYQATGLMNGTTYYFIVKAINAGGGIASNEVSATPRTVPAAPTDVAATAGNGRATVSFKAPDSGGSPIIEYRVTALPGNIEVTGTSTSITVTGLTNGTKYTFTVEARNAAGYGPQSTVSNEVTPKAPTNTDNTGGGGPTGGGNGSTGSGGTTGGGNATEGPGNGGSSNGGSTENNNGAGATQFSDIAGHWAAANIREAVKQGIVQGYADGTFKPNATVTRAEFTVMLINALKPVGTGAELRFADNAKIGGWAREAISQAVQGNIIKGFSDGTFRPNAELTRAEMASIVANALKLIGNADAANGFTDAAKLPNWAKGAIGALAEAGIMQGKSGNKFDAAATATRAEAITILLKMLAQSDK
ncbi:hypothetical protein FPZ45_08305 [Cohnella terricola]|uniref:S-layer homology domain-containing protein n=2 Tax=Cohnella terricola TaxID=1289167 RepID=A0A559JMQ0_9BACL|nr:hypothetical protein FPZ45_08305 [Cohnella terricola]